MTANQMTANQIPVGAWFVGYMERIGFHNSTDKRHVPGALVKIITIFPGNYDTCESATICFDAMAKLPASHPSQLGSDDLLWVIGRREKRSACVRLRDWKSRPIPQAAAA